MKQKLTIGMKRHAITIIALAKKLPSDTCRRFLCQCDCGHRLTILSKHFGAAKRCSQCSKNSHRPESISRKNLENLASQGIPTRTIAKQLNCSHSTIRYWLKAYNIHYIVKPGPRPRFNHEEIIPCLGCQTPISVKKYKRRYCSLKCKAATTFNRTYEKWLSGEPAFKSKSSLRAALVRHNGEKCFMCGRTRWLKNKIQLEIDHINGRPTDHRFGNVRLVCHNCHATTENFRGRNRRARKK